MSSSLEKIENELKGLGYSPFHIDNTPAGKAIAIEYTIQIGKYTGKKVFLGFSFQEEGYPEYPPHWIHISPAYDDKLGGATHIYKYPDKTGAQKEWLALSRPPKELWDDLPTKHMRNYLNLHITRFCKGLI